MLSISNQALMQYVKRGIKLALWLTFFVGIISIAYGACLNVTTDDNFISNDTTLCNNIYAITDTESVGSLNYGILIFNLSTGATLDCNGSVFIGNGTGTFINLT